MLRAALVFFLLLTVAGVRAHPILQNPVWIETSPGGLTVKMDVSVRELIVVQTDRSGPAATLSLEEAGDLAPKHSGYLLDHFHVKADGKLLTGSVAGIKPPKVIGEGLEGPDNSHFRYTIEYPLAAPPAVFTFSHNMCKEFPSAPGIPWDLSYAYRYGRKGETPVKFGALPLDREVSFSSGFVSSAGTDSGAAPVEAPVEEWNPGAITVIAKPMPELWFALWMVFVVAMALGGTLQTLWFKIAGVLWLGSYLTAHIILEYLPLWLVALLAGVVTVLTTVDTIYQHFASNATHRRIVLLLAGGAFFGIGLSHEQPGMMQGARMWMGLILICAAAAAGSAWGLKTAAARSSPRCRQLFVQLTSLVCCVAAVWLMLQLLEVDLW